MSQSDYIRYKRVAVELKDQRKNLEPVINSGQYTNYKAFTLENTILSSKPDYTKLQPQTSVNIFGMQINNPSTCSVFTLCSGTNNRVNRRALSGTQSVSQPLPLPKKHVGPSDLLICKYC